MNATSSKSIASEFCIQQQHIQPLLELGEFFSAGFFSRFSDPIIVRIAEGLRSIAGHCTLPAYRGECLYPTGPSFWNTDEVMTWHYVCIGGPHEAVLERKQKSASPEQAAALEAIARVWREYPKAGGYTHSIPNYDRVLAEGLNGFAERISRRRAGIGILTDAGAAALYDALDIILDSAAILRRRFIENIRAFQPQDAQTDRNRTALLDAYRRVPFELARTFHEAMVCTNFIMYLDGPDDLGRFDQFMQPFYETGIARDDALRLVRQLWKNIDDAWAWNVAIGGSDPSGAEASNDMTLICLEAARGRRRPNLALRLRADTPEEVWRAAFDTIETGCGLPALYCEENYIRAIREAHLNLPENDLYRYAFGGCTELMVHGCSNVGSLDHDLNLPHILVETLHARLAECGSFDQLLAAYRPALAEFIRDQTAQIGSWQQCKAVFHPQPVRSLLIDDCIDSGREYAAGGARYNWSVINVMGLGNAVDSLCAVREMVYEKRELSAGRLLDLLKNDFADAEAIRLRLARCQRYGNGDQRADSLAREVSAFVFQEYQRYAPWRGGRFLPACLMFTTYAHFGRNVGATPDGRRAGEPIADSAGPVQGRDTCGPTAMLQSVAGIDQLHAPGTLVVNARFAPNHFQNSRSRAKILDLVRSYFRMGGMQLQINVVDQETLRKAVEHPEDYGDLLIRVGGFTEYWRNLTPELRNTIVERTEH